MRSKANVGAAAHAHDFLAGGGEMGSLMRTKDWSKTAVGPVENWPQSLKTTVRMLLNSRFAMFLWWGPQLTQFYNDAYRPSFGKGDEKHPHALGQPGAETWGEIWPIIKPQIDQVLQTGVATWNVDHLVPIFRNNILEEVYWTYSYSPVYDEAGKVAGVLVTVNETTESVIARRQIDMLRELASKATLAQSIPEACSAGIRALQTNPADISFALLYLAECGEKKLHLAAHTGIGEAHHAMLKNELAFADEASPVAQALHSGNIMLLQKIEPLFNSKPASGVWEREPVQAVVAPIHRIGQPEAAGVMVLGLNPMRVYDDSYRQFIETVCTQISSNISNAQVHEEMRKRQHDTALLHARMQQQAEVTELGLLALRDTDLRTLMNVAVQRMKEVLQVDYAKVLELMPDGEHLIFRAGIGWSEEVVIDQTLVNTGKNSQAGYTLSIREPLIVQDLRTETRFNPPPLFVKHGVVSGMSCILWGKHDEPYGVLGVHSTKRIDFTTTDVAFLQAVANVLAAAIQRRQDEEALQKREQEFRALADNISNLCWMANADGFIYWYNSRWYEYTGTTPEQMLGWGWQAVHHPDTLSQVMQQWKESLATGELFDMVFPLRNASGEFRPFLTRAVPVKDSEGKVLQWFGTNTDITERENLAKQKDDFISIASHELKTPLTSVKGYIQILDSLYAEKNYDMMGDLLKGAQVNIERLAALINTLLDVSKLQAGGIQYEFTEFPVGNIVEGCIGQMKHLSKKHRIVVEGDLSINVYGDEMRLEQVVSNMLSNAIKYSPDADKVVLRVTQNNGWVKVAVTDFGIGIKQEKLPYLFDRFFRVEHSSSQFPGLGLGLYISSEIIRRHHGKMDVESAYGTGSTFWFAIPTKPGAQNRVGSKMSEPGALNSANQKRQASAAKI